MALEKGELTGQFGQRVLHHMDGTITGADPQYNQHNVNPDYSAPSGGAQTFEVKGLEV